MTNLLKIIILVIAAAIFAVNLHFALVGYYPDVPYIDLFKFLQGKPLIHLAGNS